MPPIWRQAIYAIAATFRLGWALCSRRGRVGLIMSDSDADFLSRAFKCGSCPRVFVPAKGGLRCCECGCYLDAKLRLSFESCPIGRWAAV